MPRTIAVAALAALLAACSQPEAEKSAAPAAAAAASAPAGAYAPFFTERWRATGVPITPEEVTAMVKAQGATGAVQALYGDESPSRWEYVVRNMATGDPTWVALAPSLAPGTENATSYDLQAAMQDGLTRNPGVVLPVAARLPNFGGVDAVCIEGGIETQPDVAKAFYADAIAAVEKIDDPALQDLKTGCLASLRKNAAMPVAPPT